MERELEKGGIVTKNKKKKKKKKKIIKVLWCTKVPRLHFTFRPRAVQKLQFILFNIRLQVESMLLPDDHQQTISTLKGWPVLCLYPCFAETT
jgi:hypothetical protein